MTEPQDNSDSANKAGLPAAQVLPVSPGFLGVLAGSYMWLVALICLIVAVVLVALSLPEAGIQIEVRFPEGHGLEAEDVVRFRGIDVGIVKQVQLSNDLQGVDVVVDLKPFAEPLAREGTRFWVVRPEFSLSQISGLETAVGHKYIGVLPGAPDGPPQVRFEGLAQAPADVSDRDGIEITLRAEERMGINPGSPLSFRGVPVGRVLSVGLSSDGRFVDVRARVYDEHTKLITSKTKFWATSGVDFDLRWGSGVKIGIDSLETIAKGGVSLLTPETGGLPVRPGQLFSLVAAADDEWMEQANLVTVTERRNLRAALAMQAEWKQRGLLGQSTKTTPFVGTHYRVDQQNYVLVPSDVAFAPEKATEGSFGLQVLGGDRPFTVPAENLEGGDLKAIPIPSLRFSSDPFLPEQVRSFEAPEACVVVRSEGTGQQRTFLHHPLEARQVEASGAIPEFEGDRDVWHGAPVIADRDGALLGVLWLDDSAARIVPASELPGLN